MAIPNNIIQTFKTNRLSFITRWYINRMRKQNPEWNYCFYDDECIVSFF